MVVFNVLNVIEKEERLFELAAVDMDVWALFFFCFEKRTISRLLYPYISFLHNELGGFIGLLIPVASSILYNVGFIFVDRTLPVNFHLLNIIAFIIQFS